MKTISGGRTQSFWTWSFLNWQGQRFYFNWSLTQKTKSCFWRISTLKILGNTSNQRFNSSPTFLALIGWAYYWPAVSSCRPIRGQRSVPASQSNAWISEVWSEEPVNRKITSEIVQESLERNVFKTIIFPEKFCLSLCRGSWIIQLRDSGGTCSPPVMPHCL